MPARYQIALIRANSREGERSLVVRLTPEQADKVEENATALGMSVADYLALAVQERLEREFPRLRVYHPPGTTRQYLVDILEGEVVREGDHLIPQRGREW